MAFVMNASCETQETKVFGNYFTLTPGQIKNFQDHIAFELTTSRAHQGFVTLPDEFEDPSFKNSDAGKQIIAQKKAEGVNARCRYLKEIVYNNQVSLRQDLEKANIKADPRVFASAGEIAAMEDLARYQDKSEDEAKAKVERIKDLEKKIGKIEK